VTGEGRVFDEGLQLERTALAWQRTLLTLAAASLAIGRGLEVAIGATSWVIAGAGVTVTLTLFVTVRRRYVGAHKHLTTIDATSLPSGGRLITACALLGLVAGMAALVFVLDAAL
jgi:uncharacterized membrane protein YidH (DUF202 family)